MIQDRQTDGRTNGRTDGQTDRQTDRQTDLDIKAPSRILKREENESRHVVNRHKDKSIVNHFEYQVKKKAINL